MPELFQKNVPDRCSLCGDGGALTGEHKIKASSIRAIFSGEPMMFGSFQPGSRSLLAQSAKSKAFHFRAPLCAPCNSVRTQPYDQEFARFDDLARELVSSGERASAVLATSRYGRKCRPLIDVLRYFAKVLACQIAESSGPRFIAVTDFALGRSTFNPIGLAIDTDPAFLRWREATGDAEFAGHGGLAVSFSRLTGLADGVRSTLTHGAVRYSFSIGFEPELALELQKHSPDFYAKGEGIFRATCAHEHDAGSAARRLAG